jgi:hypothetical protein
MAVILVLVVVAGLVASLLALVFDWPARVKREVLKWRGRWPIAVRLEVPGVEQVHPSGPIDFRDDPNHEGVRSVVLHLFNHAGHRRLVLLKDDSEVLGVRSARIVSADGFWIPSQEGMNAVLTLQAPRQSWAGAPVVRLKLRAETNADEKICWRGDVTPLPYDSGAPLVAFGPPPFSGGWS